MAGSPAGSPMAPSAATAASRTRASAWSVASAASAATAPGSARLALAAGPGGHLGERRRRRRRGPGAATGAGRPGRRAAASQARRRTATAGSASAAARSSAARAPRRSRAPRAAARTAGSGSRQGSSRGRLVALVPGEDDGAPALAGGSGGHGARSRAKGPAGARVDDCAGGAVCCAPPQPTTGDRCHALHGHLPHIGRRARATSRPTRSTRPRSSWSDCGTRTGIDEIRIYRMEEISFAFRPYYKVELGLAERQSAPAVGGDHGRTRGAADSRPGGGRRGRGPRRRRCRRRTEVDAWRASPTMPRPSCRPPPPAPGLDGRDRRCQRPPGAVRPLSARPARGGSSQRVVEQRRERERPRARPPRPRAAPSTAARTRMPTAARRRSHHGRRSWSAASVISTEPPSSCRTT